MAQPSMPNASAPTQRGSDFAELSKAIIGAGLLKRRYGYYTVKCALTLTAFVAGWVVFAVVGDSWWQLVTAAFLALAATHMSFTGHDAGHKQIFNGRKANDVLGLVHGGLVGLSYGWWVGKHNRHHANPNHEDDDPDVDIAVLAFTQRQGTEKRGLLRWMTKYQAFLFFPLLLLEGLGLHHSSLQSAWRGKMKFSRLEKIVLTAHVVIYLAAVFMVLSPLTGIAFILVHKAVWGVYMGCSFAPNHKGMPTVTKEDNLDFLRKQVLTSRNVRGGLFMNFTFGGLNYQIEHHLFPNMPRPNLRRAQPIVEKFCADHGISYSQCGMFRSYAEVLRHLHTVGEPLRAG